MSSRKQISNTFTVTTMDDPVSVQAQYSPDKTTIHTTWQNGDLYMRTRESDEDAWSSWHKIVGENGNETDFSFNISKNSISSNATTAPSDCYYPNWQDAPVAPTSTYPYLWMKIVEKTWNSSTQSYDSGTARYARVTGEQGAAGENAPTALASPDKVSIPCNNDGSVTSSITQGITFSLKVGSNSATVTGVSSGTKPTGVSVSGVATNAVTITIGTSATASGLAAGVTFTVTGTYNSKTYSANITVALIGATQGAQGQSITGPRGKMGRIYYYAQEWSNSSRVSYQVTDAEAPYFLYNGNYWVFNPEDNGTYTMAAMGTPSSSNTNWKMMVTDFKYIITEAIVGSFAHFGSFIINGDWMISTYGTFYDDNDSPTAINYNGYVYFNGVRVDKDNAYTYFDPYSPNGSSGDGNFVPSFAIDGLTGEAYMNEAHITGEVNASSGLIGGFRITNGFLSSTYPSYQSTIIYPDGSIVVNNTDFLYGLQIYGGAQIVGQGKSIVLDATSQNSVLRMNGDVRINENNGSKLFGIYTSQVYFNNLPTSANSVQQGFLYNDNGTLKIKM